MALKIPGHPAARGQHDLSALNFFVAAMQTGFGPFIAVWLVSQGWSLTEVGVALSIGTITGLVAQLPGGVLIDAIHQKRTIAITALAAMAISALMIAAPAAALTVWAAQILHALGSAIIAPAIAALTLAIAGHDGFSDRLGGNARFASLGSALAAATFGLAATHFGQRSIFFVTAALALPGIWFLIRLAPASGPRAGGDHMALMPPKERDTPPWSLFKDPLMHVFALCVILFHLGNAALLPLALSELSREGTAGGMIVPAAIIIPQLVVAAAAPWAGAAARHFGRRKLLLVGFLALPLRAMLFATGPGPLGLEAIQLLDGVSATILGLMPPLIAADLTRRSGHLNLAIGSFGLAAGLGATLSTTLAGFAADLLGVRMAFLGLAGAGGLATLLLLAAMPETRPMRAAAAVPLA